MDSASDSNEAEPSRKTLVGCGCESTSDIMSKIQLMPTDIQYHILCCLPFKDFVKTSVLSKEWRFKWCYLQELVFDNDYFHSCSSKHPLLSIFNILENHRGPLRKLVLSVELAKGETYLLNKMAPLLSSKCIQDFTLRVPSVWNFRLPSKPFLSEIKHLNLSSRELVFSSKFTGFSMLTHLELHLKYLAANVFKICTSKFPLLQQLILEVRRMDGPLEIDAPSLKFLYIISIKSSVIFKNVPVLSRVTIKSYGGLIAGPSSMVGNLFGLLPPLEYFSTCRNFLKYLCAGVSPKSPMGNLNHLKCLELSELCLSSLEDVQYAFLLIRLSPILRKLKIKACVEPFDDTHNLEVEKALSLVDDCSNQLQEVTIEEFSGTMPELEFLKVILAKSVVLERITIHPSKGTSVEKRLETVIAVTGFQRVSTKAEIVFSVGD